MSATSDSARAESQSICAFRTAAVRPVSRKNGGQRVTLSLGGVHNPKEAAGSLMPRGRTTLKLDSSPFLKALPYSQATARDPRGGSQWLLRSVTL